MRLQSSGSDDTSVDVKPKKLSRPERKALERQKKEQKSANQKRSQARAKYNLHSNAVSELTPESGAEDVLRAIKRAQNMHDHHDVRVIANFLLDECGEDFAYGYRGSLLARLAVAALHFGNHEVAGRAITIRRLEHRSSMLPMESAAIIRGLLRSENTTEAMELLFDELKLPLEGTPLDTTENQELLKHRALSLGSITSRYFYESSPSQAVEACKMLAQMGPIVREAKIEASFIDMPWLRIIRGAAQCESRRRNGEAAADEDSDVELPCNLVYAVLGAMTTFPSDNDDRVFEALSNALVRRVLFVTGAISMAGCPPADRGEAVFIGRSNVGKSSLVNMVTNRKSLAYTSKRPGKTQQFNYFAVNDKPGREKEIKFGDVVEGEKDLDSFYIVDLPGFGFAKVPDQQRKEWADFMRDFLANRRTLKVVFHLVDGRHGPIDEDATIMKQVGESLPKNVAYVVVLTKADKNAKGPAKKKLGKVSIDVLNTLRETMRENKVGNAPIIVTSAETKLGRDDIWRYLRIAAEA
ncbi:unnamed protein product [Cylindrotheca closterium]|uniref:EngB-type G domain-containing protein n=1 Tax=Cylindrotheca closterium TaxID=2856 RepID=A0AAD2FW70_9STRA|nr:unnamed protein product [Cylindrotheca closterium]